MTAYEHSLDGEPCASGPTEPDDALSPSTAGRSGRWPSPVVRVTGSSWTTTRT